VSSCVGRFEPNGVATSTAAPGCKARLERLDAAANRVRAPQLQHCIASKAESSAIQALIHPIASATDLSPNPPYCNSRETARARNFRLLLLACRHERVP